MAANSNWARWIFASVAKALKDVVVHETNLAVLVEQLDERTAEFEQNTDKVEIRITGPFTQEFDEGCFRIWVDTNVLLTSRYDGSKKNAYNILRIAGLFNEAMSAPIGVWNYGGEAGDFVYGHNDTLVFIGCLIPRSGINNSTKVMNFGQVDPIAKLKQSMVDARYEMYIN